MRCSSFLRVADGEVPACAEARPVAAGSAAAAMMAAPLIKTLRRDGPAFPGDFCRVIALSLIFAANRSRDPQDGVPPGSMHHTIMEWLLDLHEVAGQEPGQIWHFRTDRHACSRLCECDRSLADFAAEAGFSDQPHFSRVFNCSRGSE